jgi:hypothetical protein
MTIAIFDPTDSALQSFDWTDALPDGVTVSSVTHSVESPMTVLSESNTTTTSSAKLSGAAHGGYYMVSASATLSNGEVINRQFPIRGFNS